ncbi:hypothetical protein CRM22_005574 [Opisthorchis felineus]|uniref:BACK domain-containing protein n=1 Tax=Opisthorchis felineus TaxID=147828 RepID=A0A4S2LRV6_OPIFE|nr:hypothetical protein CRM22_005574 [Opisthorchis felineus]
MAFDIDDLIWSMLGMNKRGRFSFCWLVSEGLFQALFWIGTQAKQMRNMAYYLLEHNEDFLTLDSNLFTRLISSEGFNGLEDDRLKSIVCLAEHEATTRLTVASELLPYVQAPQLSKAYLQHLSRAKDEWECSPWLIEFLIQAHSDQLQISKNPTSGPERTRHLDYSDVIVVVGGMGAGNEVEWFDMETQTWTTSLSDQTENHHNTSAFPAIPNFPCKKSACAAVVLEKCLYVLGGETTEPTRSVEIYDQIHQRWISGPEMQYARCHLGASVLANNVYAIGGRDECEENSSFTFAYRMAVWSLESCAMLNFL